MSEILRIVLERSTSMYNDQEGHSDIEDNSDEYIVNCRKEEIDFRTVSSNAEGNKQTIIQYPNNSCLMSNQGNYIDSLFETQELIDESNCDEFLQKLAQRPSSSLNKIDDDKETNNYKTIQTFTQTIIKGNCNLSPQKLAHPKLKNEIVEPEEMIIEEEKQEDTNSESVFAISENITEKQPKEKRKDYGKDLSLVIMLLKIWVDFRKNKKSNSEGRTKKFTAEEASLELGLQNKTMEYYRLELNKAVALGKAIDISLFLNKSFGELHSEVTSIIKRMKDKEAKAFKSKFKDPQVKRAFLNLLNDFS